MRDFKADMDSITMDDINALREAKAKHAIKLDDLDLTLKVANEYVSVMTEFLESIGFSSDRIDAFESRRRDGYIPFSHNKGGIQGICYRDQYSCCQDTGFENTDAVLAKYSNYNLESFAKDRGLDVSKYSEWTEKHLEDWYEYEQSDEDTVQFQARIMMTSETTANVDLYVSASDTPYHRESDDKLELTIEFKTPAGMRRKLNAILKNAFVQTLSKNVKEGF